MQTNLKGVRGMNKKKEVLDALADWVIRTANKKDLATPEEIAALPKVAEVVFKNYSPVKKV